MAPFSAIALTTVWAGGVRFPVRRHISLASVSPGVPMILCVLADA